MSPIVRKVKTFADPDLDYQIMEIVLAVNALTPAKLKALPAQPPTAVDAECTDLTTALALVNQLRGALIAWGICS